jgi:hypothetical protein
MGIWIGRGCPFTNCIHNTGKDEGLAPSKRKRCRKRKPRMLNEDDDKKRYCLDEVDYRDFNK